eukprot:jgi/Ulvmu1/11461/UM077_0004.1
MGQRRLCFMGTVSRWAKRLRNPHDWSAHVMVCVAVLLGEALLTAVIIVKVPYTEIDWQAYIEEVDGFLGGELDYANLRGGTGPLVYPAGFVYLFSAIRWLTQASVEKAQVLFAVLYLATQALVMLLYARSAAVPPYLHVLIAASKRMHSIYVLRLFNDCWTMLITYAAVGLLAGRRTTAAIVVFSLAVSTKMNALLFAPGVLAVCLLGASAVSIAWGVGLGAAVQVALAVPFLMHAPQSYLSRAFDFSRVFMYKWTVNWRMLPEDVFLSRGFAALLLSAHLLLLVAFFHRKWTVRAGGIVGAVTSCLSTTRNGSTGSNGKPGSAVLTHQQTLTAVFTANFVGIVCARSLHYQFYSWYFHSIPFLLWQTKLPVLLRLALFAAIEAAWNVFPSTVASSSMLLAAHLVLLGALWPVS